MKIGSITGRVCAVIALLVACLSPAFAHAVLLKSIPEANSLSTGPAITVQLTFNSRVDGKLSRITLVTPDNRLYPLDIQPQLAPETLTAPAKGLTEGKYRIRWQVLASDGHITRGEVPIRIKKPD